jgi:hypothetical protein
MNVFNLPRFTLVVALGSLWLAACDVEVHEQVDM